MRPSSRPLVPYTTFFRSVHEPDRAVGLDEQVAGVWVGMEDALLEHQPHEPGDRAARQVVPVDAGCLEPGDVIDSQAGELFQDRKSTRLNSSHVAISYAVF